MKINDYSITVTDRGKAIAEYPLTGTQSKRVVMRMFLAVVRQTQQANARRRTGLVVTLDKCIPVPVDGGVDTDTITLAEWRNEPTKDRLATANWPDSYRMRRGFMPLADDAGKSAWSWRALDRST